MGHISAGTGVARALTVAALALAPSMARADAAESGRRPRSRVTIAAVGDVLFGRYVSPTEHRRVPKTDEPFAGVADVIGSVDIAFANLETPVMPEPKVFKTHRRLTFRADAGDVDLLADAGFDIISIANNHTLNLGHHGAPLTRNAVSAAGLIPIGAGATADEAHKPAIIERDGLRIAFIARTVWTNGRAAASEDGAVARLDGSSLRTQLSSDVHAARTDTGADFVVVSLHWGIERELHPEDYQRRCARAAVEAGADLVLGHHPHVVQDVERYKGGVIVYSLGNFLFDNPSRRQRETMIFTAAFERGPGGDRVVDVVIHPVLINRKTRAPELTGNRGWRRRLRQMARKIELAAPPAAEKTAVARGARHRKR